MPHIIVTHLSNFMTLILCNTMRRKVTETLKVGDACDAYRHHLMNFSKQLEDMKFYGDYIDYFVGYCTQQSYHALFDVMQKDIAGAFCGHDVAAQFGASRMPIVVKGIFLKTFREAADRLIKTPNVLDMVANGAQNARDSCARIVNMAISDVMTDYLSGDVAGDGKDTAAAAPKVSSKTYEALKEKYRRLTFAYNDIQHKLDKTLEKYEESATRLKEAGRLIQGYKVRLREVEEGMSSFKSLERPVDGRSRLSEAEKSVITDLSKKATSRDRVEHVSPPDVISIIPEAIEPDDSISNAPTKKAKKSKAAADSDVSMTTDGSETTTGRRKKKKEPTKNKATEDILKEAANYDNDTFVDFLDQ